jgi:hypothetical protein
MRPVFIDSARLSTKSFLYSLLQNESDIVLFLNKHLPTVIPFVYENVDGSKYNRECFLLGIKNWIDEISNDEVVKVCSITNEIELEIVDNHLVVKTK